MFDIPISALLICYGPLAITVIGFVLFAAATDLDARRTYLRRLDLRPEDELPEVLPPLITQPTDAQTPSGARVRIIPEENGNPPPAPVAQAVSAPPAEAPTPAPAPAEAAEDDLTKIEGIGPKMSAALKDAGITTFAELAARSEEELREVIENAGMRLAPGLGTWPEQAAFAAKGDWEGLEKLQNELKGGRRE